MNLVDYLALAFMAYGIWRGWRKGFGYELPGLISVAVFTLTGFGAIRWTYIGLSSASNFSPIRMGILTAPLLFVVAFMLIRRRLKIIQTWADQRFQGAHKSVYGAAAGLLRTAIISGFLVVYLGLLNIGFVHRTFAERSLFGRTLTTCILPVYQTLAGHEEETPAQTTPDPTMQSESASESQGRMPSTSSKR
jgi:hypothetical protein